MTLRIRHHLALPPLFAGLAAAAFALAVAVHRREIAWVLAEQAQARALCLAAFADPAPASLAAALARHRQDARRLGSAAGGLNVQWFEREGSGWRAQALCEAAGLRPAPPPDGDVLRQLHRGRPAALARPRPEAAFDEAVGYAPIVDHEGRLRAVIGVTGPETITRSALREVQRASGWFGAALLVAGFAVAEGLARGVRRDLAGLAAGAAALARGDYAHAWPSSAMRELEDLARTLESIAHILHDGERRARHRLLSALPSPTPEELALAARRLRAPPPCGPGQEIPAGAARRLGGADDDFYAMRRNATGWHVVAGRLRNADETAPLLDRLTRAEAAADCLGGLLDALEPPDAWRELDASFPVDRGMSLSVAPGATEPVVYRHGVGTEGSPPPRAEPPHHRPVVLGTLDDDARRRVEDFLRHAPPHPLEQTADLLAALLAGRARGLLVVVALPASLS